ncbi:MAG: glycosyltransferase family 4 protein [Bacteroidota bacterium]
MHIVFLSGEYPLWTSGGVGTFIQTLGRALVSRDHRVSVVGIGKDDREIELEDQGVKIYRLPVNKGKLPNFWVNSKRINKKLSALHAQHPIDILESAEGGMALISSKHKAKRVVRLHGGHHFFAEAEKRSIQWRRAQLEKRSFKRADGFIAVSTYVKEHTANYLSYYGKPMEVIHLPLDVTVQLPDVPLRENNILFAGTICEKKGVRELLQAFRLVRERYPEKQLDLYGREWYYPNGGTYEAMLRDTYDASYFENVHFQGSIPRDQLDTKYAEAAFCVFPSHMETQGLVCLEAMLMAKAVVFTQYGPGPETVEDGHTGWLCDVYNPDDIAQKMIWCIEHPEKARQMGESARQQVIRKYDASSILEQNISFYQKLIDHQ